MWASPFALRARLALSFKGLRYQYKKGDLSNKSDLLLCFQPERAMARFWAAFIIDDKRLKPTFAAIETLEAAFRECSKGKPFFGGDSVGYLDRAMDWNSGASRSPLLNAWVERFSALDEMRAVLPDIDRLVEYAKMREALAAAANR
ncbi:hypothetical protein SORBI_3001G318366 [Sorghum bicolor]|uniref:Glutathione S-transferase n=1 Tax=Sorghum bicolor TaxID=4558 RepID=A0A1Z5S8V0_SORBI|nr:hypothetical protein SORBI_3001G318366 [Sorghum bicolor]